jgi:RNA polymerase sigma-70 factor (ECF subfamily)
MKSKAPIRSARDLKHAAHADRRPKRSGGNAEAGADAALVRRFKAGDESAFSEIIARYYARIRALANRVLHNESDAEEVAQDTFIRAHRGLVDFRGDSSLAVWLHRIGLNLARNRYSFFVRRQRHATISLDLPLAAGSDNSLADAMCGDTADPRSESITSEFVTLVADCMERLAPLHREILGMRTMLNLSNEEIAVRLKINVGTVRSRVARARESLRALLQQSAP